jgi:hypothetical protein
MLPRAPVIAQAGSVVAFPMIAQAPPIAVEGT